MSTYCKELDEAVAEGLDPELDEELHPESREEEPPLHWCVDYDLLRASLRVPARLYKLQAKIKILPKPR